MFVGALAASHMLGNGVTQHLDAWVKRLERDGSDRTQAVEDAATTTRSIASGTARRRSALREGGITPLFGAWPGDCG